MTGSQRFIYQFIAYHLAIGIEANFIFSSFLSSQVDNLNLNIRQGAEGLILLIAETGDAKVFTCVKINNL